MKRRYVILLLVILIFAAFLRLFSLTQNPEGFDQTEAAFAYNAFSVLRSGASEDGKFLPWVLVSIGDYKLAGYMYWQIPFIALFGLNEFSARFSTAVAGIISLFLVYYIVYELFKNKKLALLTCFFTSIAPWHLILSRMAYDPMIAFMFYLLSIASFMYWSKTKRLIGLLVSSVGLAWSMGTYYAVWVLFPFTILYFAVHLFKKHLGFKKKIFLAVVLFALPLFTLFTFLSITRGTRLQQDSTFQVTAQPLLEELIREDQHEFPLLVTRFFHNKLIFYPQIFLQQFFTNLSFDFLFLNGDKFDRRFWVPYQGVLYLWSAPFVFLGLLYFWKKETIPKNLLLWGIIGVVFLGSAFSEFGSESERTLFVVPVFCLLMSYSLLILEKEVRSRSLIISFVSLWFVGGLLFLNVSYFNHQYYYHANVHQAWGRNYGARLMLTKLEGLKSKYEKVVIPDSAYIYYYFYNQIDPHVAWTEAESRLDQTNYLGLQLRKQVGEYLTMPIACPLQGKLKTLYVCNGTKIPVNTRVLDTIYYRDRQPAFIFLEFLPERSTELPPQNVTYLDAQPIIAENDPAYW